MAASINNGPSVIDPTSSQISWEESIGPPLFERPLPAVFVLLTLVK